MSKKSRRFRTPNLPPEAYAAASDGAPVAAPISIVQEAAAPVFVDLKNEYKEVLGDLRKTFIIFISMVVVMLVLSFVI